MRGNHVYRNDGPGIWCDIDCRDAVIEDNTVEFNRGAGIFYEISFDALVRRNTLRFNGVNNAPWYWDADIQVAASQGVEVADNDIAVRPGGRAIMLIDQGRRRRTAASIARRATAFTATGSSSRGRATRAASRIRIASPNGSIIEAGANSFEANTYTAPLDALPGFVWGRDALTFAAFQSLGQERKGRLTFGVVPP